ncbi:E3 ubiquitin-protein ligase TRIM45 isoform X1 [Cavia porcellus]|uniref:E3 ubiquitin-protein ligase TRIM45 isoform X1 n=1 Tax=Cavia porcellus TaxID=10141 RepID=UPI0006619FB1|nr:tripartite motif-containing protein 45 isoform X1 [Cavia porcellus]
MSENKKPLLGFMHKLPSGPAPANSGKTHCPLCMGLFKAPRLLPCLHTVCTSCLEKLEPFSVVDLRGADSDTSSEGSVFQEHKPQNLQRQIGILCPGSPFTVTVRRKHRPHPGVFHCCTFCSSGGRKTARCACGGTMPGGYLGCGHGHKGHPGRPHWSCCGKFTEKSECTCTSGQNTPRSLLRTVAL